jgi:Reverse transcriptase (RNA-dependent DNA polymerase)
MADTKRNNGATHFTIFKGHDVTKKKTFVVGSDGMYHEKYVVAHKCNDLSAIPESDLVLPFRTICGILNNAKIRMTDQFDLHNFYNNDELILPGLRGADIAVGFRPRNRMTCESRNKQLRYQKAMKIMSQYHHYEKCGCITCLKKIVSPILISTKQILSRIVDDDVMVRASPFDSLFRLQEVLHQALDPLNVPFTSYHEVKAKSTFSAMEFLNENRNLTTTCSHNEVMIYFQDRFRRVVIDEPNDPIRTYPITTNGAIYRKLRVKKKNKRIYMGPISHSKIKHELVKVVEYTKGGGKAETPDHTGFTKGLLKKVCKYFSPIRNVLTRIDNLIRIADAEMLETTLPEEWYTIYNYPKIKKVDGPRDDPSNFRLMTSHLKIVSLVHTWVANNLQSHLIDQKLWDNKIQKAYGEGTSSAIRRLMEAQEGVDSDIVFGFMDIKNAYGSIDRDFILRVMKEYQVPAWIQNYFRVFYSKLRVKVTGCADESESDDVFLQMERGILQGDHLSNIVFVMCMFYIMSNVKAVIKTEVDGSSTESPSDRNTLSDLSAFVDDIAFLSFKIERILKLITIFVRVCRSTNSGLEFNFDKSVLMIIDNDTNNSYRAKIVGEYPNGVPIQIDDEIIGIVRVSETDELIRYLGVHIDASSNPYGMRYSTFMTHEMTAQFEEAEKIMSRKFGKDSSTRINGNHPKYGFIVKKIFDHIASRTAWKIDRLVTTYENKEMIETRLSNVMRHFAHRWSVDVKSINIDSYKSEALSLKNAIRTILIEAEDPKKAEKKIKAIDDMVIEMVRGRLVAIHTLREGKSSTNPYKCDEL